MDFLFKIGVFAVYLILLTTVLNGIKDFVLAHTNISSFMTPTMCFFLNQLNAFGLLGAYFAFKSSNWLKSMIVKYWTAW